MAVISWGPDLLGGTREEERRRAALRLLRVEPLLAGRL
jgi:hypothetical protein